MVKIDGSGGEGGEEGEEVQGGEEGEEGEEGKEDEGGEGGGRGERGKDLGAYGQRATGHFTTLGRIVVRCLFLEVRNRHLATILPMVLEEGGLWSSV